MITDFLFKINSPLARLYFRVMNEQAIPRLLTVQVMSRSKNRRLSLYIQCCDVARQPDIILTKIYVSQHYSRYDFNYFPPVKQIVLINSVSQVSHKTPRPPKMAEM